MKSTFSISVVIPTCNRKLSLLRLLASLNKSKQKIAEVIIVDSGDDRLTDDEVKQFKALPIQYIFSARSVCIQRNTGIKKATSLWIFLCDDDLEVPENYLTLLIDHLLSHPAVGAVSGIVLQQENSKWEEQYPVTSSWSLLWKFIFQLGIWGEIRVKNDSLLIRAIKNFYKRKGNHLSKGGWPVVTDFSGEFFVTPVYGLGASLVKREWLLNSPYDEVLDAHGIGDNYGVAAGFQESIHVLKKAFVYHHRSSENRLPPSLGYYRRLLALDYFIKTKPQLKNLSNVWFTWSLFGNFIAHLLSKKSDHAMASIKAVKHTVFLKNPYLLNLKNKHKASESTN